MQEDVEKVFAQVMAQVQTHAGAPPSRCSARNQLAVSYIENERMISLLRSELQVRQAPNGQVNRARLIDIAKGCVTSMAQNLSCLQSPRPLLSLSLSLARSLALCTHDCV